MPAEEHEKSRGPGYMVAPHAPAVGRAVWLRYPDSPKMTPLPVLLASAEHTLCSIMRLRNTSYSRPQSIHRCQEQSRRKAVTQSHGATAIQIAMLAGPPVAPTPWRSWRPALKSSDQQRRWVNVDPDQA